MAKILTKTYEVRSNIAEERRPEGSGEFVRTRVTVSCEFEVAATDLVTDADGKRRLAPEVKARLQAAIAPLVRGRRVGPGSALRVAAPVDIKMTRLGVYHGTSEAGICRGYFKAQYRRDTWWA